MNVASYALTDVGRRRTENEDAFIADEEVGLFAVCDGMGGHAAGEIASTLALEILRKEVRSNTRVLRALAADASGQHRAAAVELMERAVQRACREIYRMAEADPTKRGMGTTCAALLIAGGKGVIAHVGDSRIYLLRNGQLHQLTEDHTLVQTQLKQGVITPDEAETSPFRNVITRAVGIQESVQVDTLLTDILPGDLFLLCSDGLHGYLDEAETQRLLSTESPDRLPRILVDLANERGGRDNITVVIVRATGAADPERVSEAEARLQAIQRIPLFRHLTYKEQMAVLAIAHSRSWDAGRIIVEEGQPGDQLFIVVKGRVSIETEGQVLAELRPGAHFGEMGLIEHAPRFATVRAVEPTTCVVLGRNELLALMRREPVLAVKLLWSLVHALSERLRAANAGMAMKGRRSDPTFFGKP
ncbi:MAG TPA: Stp1/IreP family PP2C-type Ser/Thr phosphatase [Fredinandcohnia sp.]|nr:Stp1/IreP family PP2C-type Ser/Thr phosphatase [Fredinandcohnia sp.]